MAKQLSYRHLLCKSNEQKQSEEIDFDVEQKELQLSADISETKKALSAKKKERETYAGSKNLDFKQLSVMDDEIAGLEAGVKRLEQYKEDFFPAEK
jgi:hypothetical protein